MSNIMPYINDPNSNKFSFKAVNTAQRNSKLNSLSPRSASLSNNFSFFSMNVIVGCISHDYLN